MSIRPARYQDIPAMTVLLKQGHERSKYAGRCGFDSEEARQLFLAALGRTEVKGAGGTCCFVTEVEGVVEGLILGMTERVYHVGDKLRASDVFFYVSDRATNTAALRLMKAFEAWAADNHKVIEIILGATDVIDEPERLADIYEKRGYMRCGLLLERRVDGES